MESTYRPILHVEDDENEVFLLSRAMGVAGIAHPVQVVRSGARAINYLRGLSPFEDRNCYPLPSLILLDWNMPEMGGLAVLKWRQSQPAIKLIPVIVVTSSHHAADVTAAYEAGANGYLAKPVAFEGLVEMAGAIRNYWLLHNHYALLPDETNLLGDHLLPTMTHPVNSAAVRSLTPEFAR